MSIKKPMKAEDFVESNLVFPYFASVKLDGYRAFVEDGVLLTSSGKPVSNAYTQRLFGRAEFNGLDGELIVGGYSDPRAFHNTSGPVRRATGEPDVRWYVFDDRTRPQDTFTTRSQSACRRVEYSREGAVSAKRIEYLPQHPILTLADMLAFEQSAVASGFEGIMLRSPEGPYKFGRSTLDENYLLKVKRFITEEARITGYIEQMENLNESYRDELGRAKKSTDKDMLVGTGMVGAFIVESSKWPRPFNISATSLTHDERKEAFQMFDSMYHLKLARFKYFPHGVVDVPRHGVFEAIRGEEDL
jgi:DNA ligase 1